MHKKIFQALIMGIVLILSLATAQAARLPVVGEDSNQWGTLLNDYLQVSHDENGTLKATLSPTFAGLTLSGNLNLSGNRLIIDDPGPTFTGASSRQTIQADAIFSGFTGTYGAGVMGNAVSGTIGTGDSIIGGIIGKYNLVDSDPSDHPQGAVIGEIGEDVGTTTLPDGAFIAVLGGDTAEVDAGAAYTVRYLNSVPGSQFNYGLDLYSAAIDSYNPVTYSTADIRLSNGATIYNNDANTLTITEGTIILDGALTLNSGVINTAEILDNTITDADIADNSLTALSLATSSVESDEILDGTIATADIADLAVTNSKIADNSINNSMIQTDAVTASKIEANAVGASEIGSGVVSSDEIADNSVASADIANGAITNEDISTLANISYSRLVLTNSIVTGDITNDAITSALIAAGTIVSSDINDGSITNEDISTLANITYSRLVLTNSIVSGDVAADTLTAADLAANSVEASELANDAVDSGAIAADAVTTGKILDGTIATADIANDAITSALIAAGTIVSSDINDGSITNEDISTLANITYSRLVLTNSIVTGDITNDAITSALIAADSVALTTDTTGNYVTSVGTSALTGLTGGAAASEGATLSLALDYTSTLADNPALAANVCVFSTTGLICEGATANLLETLLTVADPVADVTITFPATTGNVVTTGDTGTVTNTMLAGSIAASKLIGTDIATVGTITAGTWQGTTIAVANGGTGATTLTDGGILLGSGTGAITALGVAANGQIPIGDGTTDPVLATLTGTTNQITVTNGAGSITLSTPQDIATTSSPTFNGLTLTTLTIAEGGITDSRIVSADIKDGEIASADIATDTIVTGDLAATLTFADADLVDLGSILHNDAAAQGLRLPNSAGGAPTAMTGNPEGHIAWDATNNLLYVSTDAGWASTFTNTGSANTWTNTNSFNDAVTIGDAAADVLTITSTLAGGSPLVLEGATANEFETTIAVTDPTADRTVTIPDASGTVAYIGNPLSQFAATTSAELAGVISDETGSGASVFANSPSLVTPALGAATATSINIGTGTTISKHLSGTETLDFAVVTSPACSADLTITVTGAADGDTVALAVPNAAQAAGSFFTAWVSTVNTVTVRHCSVSGDGNPASATFRVDVWQH